MTGETELVLLREDEQAAYPVVSGIPVLLAPEVLSGPRVQRALTWGICSTLRRIEMESTTPLALGMRRLCGIGLAARRKR